MLLFVLHQESVHIQAVCKLDKCCFCGRLIVLAPQYLFDEAVFAGQNIPSRCRSGKRFSAAPAHAECCVFSHFLTPVIWFSSFVRVEDSTVRLFARNLLLQSPY